MSDATGERALLLRLAEGVVVLPKTPALAMRQLETACGPFAVEDFGGGGPDLLLVHGTGHNLAVWAPLAECLRGHFRVAAFDLEQCTTVHHHQADLLIALAGQRLVHGLPPNPVTLVTVDAAALLLGQMALAHVVEAEITGESRR